MKTLFSQVYVELDAQFPFSHHFQRRLSREVTELAKPSEKFVGLCGADGNLIFNVSAKRVLRDNEVRGPTVFKRTKDVEFTIFLPFDQIIKRDDAPKVALDYLLKGVAQAFEALDIDTEPLLRKRSSLIESICSGKMMLEEPSWDKEENDTRVRTLFTAFFEGKRTSK